MEKEALFKYLLRIGDSSLILGQRMAEWCSKGPILEEDLAMTNIALDLFGQANSILGYAAQLEGSGRDADTLAFRRNERGYYNYLIVERPNGDFGFTMLRQFLYSTFAMLQYETLCKSPDERLAAIAAKSLKEIKYHFRHSGEWVVRLADGTEESRSRMLSALDELWSYTANLFETDEVDELLVKQGIISDVKELAEPWREIVTEVFQDAGLDMPEDGYMHSGSLKGIHSEALGHILGEMQYLQNAYPDASW